MVTEDKLEQRIDALDQKMDLILEHLQRQKANAGMVEDLVGDLNIIGKDVYGAAVRELDNRQLKIDGDEVTDLAVTLVRNIGNIKTAMESLEMAVDLGKDVGPIANEMIIDFTKKMHEFEKKGYFDFFREFGPIIDNIVKGFSPEDLKELANSIVSILKTVKEMTQPEVIATMQNAIKAFNSMETESVPSYSIWKLMREMNSPEMKKALGYGITFMKNVSQGVKVEE
jgi:uncharacterized protein YjgD (DUF1641 family)